MELREEVHLLGQDKDSSPRLKLVPTYRVFQKQEDMGTTKKRIFPPPQSDAESHN